MFLICEYLIYHFDNVLNLNLTVDNAVECGINQKLITVIMTDTITIKVHDYKTSFLYLVLKALKSLHGLKKTAKGAKLNDVVKYLSQTYNIPGDVKSQVQNALDIGEEYRFIQKANNKFILISPVATLQLMPDDCKNYEMERIQQIFQHSWYTRKRRRDASTESYSCPEKRKQARMCPSDASETSEEAYTGRSSKKCQSKLSILQYDVVTNNKY